MNIDKVVFLPCLDGKTAGRILAADCFITADCLHTADCLVRVTEKQATKRRHNAADPPPEQVVFLMLGTFCSKKILQERVAFLLMWIIYYPQYRAVLYLPITATS
jgi:hypothetical protein